MAWVFQGNPKKFDINDYLARHPELVYWCTPRYQAEISVGDRAIVWRSGPDSGAIAMGTVVEEPTPGTNVEHPVALADNLWRAEGPDPSEPLTGIHLDEIRLTAEENYVPRGAVKQDPSLAQTTLIKMPNGTVFRLNQEQTQSIERLWWLSSAEPPVSQEGETEGKNGYDHIIAESVPPHSGTRNWPRYTLSMESTYANCVA